MSRRGSAPSGPGLQDDEIPMKKMKLDQNAQLVTTNIDHLPDEILLQILSFLTFLELSTVAQYVCIRWLRLSHDPILWRNKDFIIGASHSDNEVVNILHNVPQLRDVVMERYVEEPVFRALYKKCRRLNRLKIYPSQNISHSLLNKLVKNCQNINSLAIPHHLLNDERKARALGKLNKMQALHVMNSNEYKNPVHLRPLADGCCELAMLKVDSRVEVSTTDLEYFIRVKCKTLTHLKMPWGWYKRSSINLQLKMNSSLIYLELNDYGFRILNTEDLEAFIMLGHLSTLHTLILNGYWICFVEESSHLLRSGGLSNLQMLEISDCFERDNFMDAIYIGCPQLQELRLNGVDLSDESLRQLRCLTKLETLALISCHGLNGAALSYVAQVPTLRKLFIERCDLRELESGLEHILDISSLEFLSFGFSRYACRIPFERIAEKLTNLRVLNVAECEINKRVLERLKEQMPGLRIDTADSVDRDKMKLKLF